MGIASSIKVKNILVNDFNPGVVCGANHAGNIVNKQFLFVIFERTNDNRDR
ncbi:MAG: hypothetical protein ONB46_18455 [candidate division KSB1 bacterium]|nr:hypothetical protein [candidate division KSB1 bacterium]MDZ7367840.1 hypothetical protein [candidate division KSB1 bacterium]